MARILICSQGIPHPTDGASVVLFFHYIDRLRRDGYQIHHLLLLSGESWTDAQVDHYAGLMGSADFTISAVRVPSFFRPGRYSHQLVPAVADAVRGAVADVRPDLLLAFDFVAAWAAAPFSNIKRIVWLGDLQFQTQYYHAVYAAKESLLAARHIPTNWISCLGWKKLYGDVLRDFGTVIVSSHSSEAELARLGVAGEYEPYPWPADAHSGSAYDTGKPSVPTLLFFGSLGGLGSRSALHFTLFKIIPALRRLWGKGNFRILIAGRGALPDWTAKALADMPEIERLGFVENLGAVLASCHAALVPIDVPVGNRSRILTAMAGKGLVIAHRNAALGNPALIDGVTCYLADSADDFADRARRAFEDHGAVRDIVDRAYRCYLDEFSIEAATSRLSDRVKTLIDVKRNAL